MKNLYLGGASVAPGGMVLFGPGYNCAKCGIISNHRHGVEGICIQK